MSDTDYKMLAARFERLSQQCDTAEKATEQLKREGLLDAFGPDSNAKPNPRR